MCFHLRLAYITPPLFILMALPLTLPPPREFLFYVLFTSFRYLQVIFIFSSPGYKYYAALISPHQSVFPSHFPGFFPEFLCIRGIEAPQNEHNITAAVSPMITSVSILSVGSFFIDHNTHGFCFFC